MIRFRIRRSRGAVAALLLASCSGQRLVPGTADPEGIRQYLATHHPADLRVTKRGGAALWLHRPRLEGDSLTGTLSREEPRAHRVVALDSIHALAVPHFSAGRTVGLIAGLAAAAALTLFTLASGNDVSY